MIWICTAFVWGIIVGFIIHRGISTGKWSMKP